MIQGRHGQRASSEWKINIRKRLRNSGKEYVSSRGMKINGKAMKPSCPDTCHLKCSTKIDEEERNNIFRGYWEIADKREQQYFLVRHVQELPSCRKELKKETQLFITISKLQRGRK